jgi:23S rRNA pseudouridine2605 synthase
VYTGFVKSKNTVQQSKVPLERAISKLGLASRSQGRKMVLDGRVKVNGMVRRDPLYLVAPGSTRIEIDNVSVAKVQPVVLMLHKPRSTVTTRSDEKGRPTVFSLLKDSSLYLHAVGRLDYATTGLLLLTNDSQLSAWLTDPKNALKRTYVVTVRGEITEEKRLQLENGVHDEGELLRASEVVLRKSSKPESHLIVTLQQGKNREIRRLFLAIGHEVTRLKRISFGGLNLGDLALGSFREVSDVELSSAFPNRPRSKS